MADPNPDIYWSDNYVTLDFETTTIQKGSSLIADNSIVLASWKQGSGSSIRSHFAGEYDQGELAQAIEEADFIVAHNAKFELGWLRRCGLDLRSVVVFDTFIAEYVLGGNTRRLVDLGLGASLKRYGLEGKKDLVGFMLKCGLPTEHFPQSWLQEYCERDVEATHELFIKQRQALKDAGQLHLLYQRCLLTPALVDIEQNGMQLDEVKVDEAIAELEDDYARITSELQEFMDGAPPSSTKQKCEFIFNTLKFAVPRDHKGKPMLTKSGTPSVAAEVLTRLKPKTERQKKFLNMHTEWSKMHSDLTKYLRKFKECCTEAGGSLQALFNQCATRTHRLSSSGMVFKVQFQNLNRKFKPIFKARNPGWLIGEADGAQLEFRIATHMGRDPVGYHDIVTGVDVHKYTASVLLMKPESMVTRAERQDAKADTFKPTYGGTSGTPAQQRYYKAFADKYAHLTATQRGWTHKVLADKRLTTEYGLVFKWPDCKMTQSGWIMYSTNIYNYPVQGFATAEIIPCAIVCAWHRMKDAQSFLVNTVHDSIIAEVHPEEIDLWHDVAKQCLIKDAYMMLEKLYNVKLTVPLGAGVMVGTHWASAEAKDSEVTYEADPLHYEEAAKEAGML